MDWGRAPPTMSHQLPGVFSGYARYELQWSDGLNRGKCLFIIQVKDPIPFPLGYLSKHRKTPYTEASIGFIMKFLIS